ncbi:nuclear transport factor 2 family protein [Pseudoduganella violacea]|uniref:Ketosteroid isomerase-like protein n=1 Tax=Pseudoduganella violacea TaxID=1715466 RepID=A0A7W5FVF7_9BURK|nr:nuclear transport factor 2 family protein [Pseudoduganella violacea]MBB3120754.1 ketosteroid isomerase-like protein [Pseudoduganella violacea]
MSSDLREEIRAIEERLRLAMLASDQIALDELISPELTFTNHLGQVCGKQDDLALHRSGILKFHLLQPSEQHIQADAQLAIVSVRMMVAGSYEGHAFSEDLRYTRVWRSSADGKWTIMAGHSSRVAASPA